VRVERRVGEVATTVDYRGEGSPRFAAGCAACRADGPMTAVRFAGAKEKSSLGDYVVSHAAYAAAVPLFLNAPLELRVAGAVVLVAASEALALVQHRKRRARSFEVPLCARCSADVLSIRHANRELLATLVICAATAIGIAQAFESATWVESFLIVCGVVAVLAMLKRAWHAIRETDRFEVESRVGVVHIRFADAEAARRFAALNER
jgi:hypothetical protein